jgi:hypothetical protein
MSTDQTDPADPTVVALAADAADAIAAAAAAGIPAIVTTGGPVENRWSKNGYGVSCPPHSSGKFSKQESETVRAAIEEYCEAKGITPARLCSECDHKAELKGAWMEIARALPHRTVQSVYRHGLRQLHPFKRGAWTEDEVGMLIGSVERYGKKWAAIQQKLNRSADSCRDKYREISVEYTKGRWKDEEAETLKALIREHLRADPNADMVDLAKHCETEQLTLPWSTISKKMGKRSRLSCFKKWQKMTGTGDKPKYKPVEGVVVKAPAPGAAQRGGGGVAASPDLPPALGDTPNPIAEAVDDEAAQIAAETVEAVDLPDTRAQEEQV